MNLSLIRLAGAVSKKPLRIKEELLPSIVLYRRLLRIHRKVLPNEMRLMGDDYVKVRPSSSLSYPEFPKVSIPI